MRSLVRSPVAFSGGTGLDRRRESHAPSLVSESRRTMARTGLRVPRLPVVGGQESYGERFERRHELTELAGSTLSWGFAAWSAASAPTRCLTAQPGSRSQPSSRLSSPTIPQRSRVLVTRFFQAL